MERPRRLPAFVMATALARVRLKDSGSVHWDARAI